MRKILYSIVVMLALAGPAYGQSEIPMITMSKKVVSIGVKAGFNASFNSTKYLTIGDVRLEDFIPNNKVGYTVGIFTRFNFKKHHYLQPELTYDITKSSLIINETNASNGVVTDNAYIKTKIHSLNLPILYGYKFVDKGIYGMSFVVGPQISWFIPGPSKNTYEGFYQKNIQEEFNHFNYSAVIGLGVNISNIYFDLRYAMGLNDITKSVTFDKAATPEPYNEMDLDIRRNRNILSFSIGAIF